jgi:electron transport complex protein RnfG
MLLKSVSKNSLVLGAFAIATTGLVVATQLGTAQRIDEQQEIALQKSLAEVLPEGAYDNAVGKDTMVLAADPLLGTSKPSIAYVAKRGNQPQALVIQAVAPEGYGGSINLLVGIDKSGKITGVRAVTPHAETPGLGDKIELKKSPWVLGFNGKSLEDPEPARWGVKKDGGVFDAFTGATITPRAVVGAVKNTLTYVNQHQATLFATPAGETPHDAR